MVQIYFDFKCYLCSGLEYKIRPGKVRDNHKLFPLECLNCGLVTLSSFDHIAEGFYENSQMHDTPCDADIICNVIDEDDKRRFANLKDYIKNKRILDFGCGQGGFLRQAKTCASLVCGIEPELSMQKILIEQGIKVLSGIEDLNEGEEYDFITLFHVLEHIPNPLPVLHSLFDHLSSGGHLIIEVPSADDALLVLYENKEFSEFTYWSCRLYLYTPSTLQTLLERAGFKVVEMQQFQRYPLANHLYWLAKGLPGGQKKWPMFNDSKLVAGYRDILAGLGKCDTVIGVFSK